MVMVAWSLLGRGRLIIITIVIIIITIVIIIITIVIIIITIVIIIMYSSSQSS